MTVSAPSDQEMGRHMSKRVLTLSAIAGSVSVLIFNLAEVWPPAGADRPMTDPPNGPAVDRYYDTVREEAAGLPTHTVYQPADLSRFRPNSLPIVVWANGSCRASNWGYISTLTVLASHGFVVVVVNEETWQSLTDEQREALQDAVSTARDEDRACIEEQETSLVEEWRTSGTMEIVEPDVDAFRERAESFFTTELDEGKLELYQAIRELA